MDVWNVKEEAEVFADKKICSEGSAISGSITFDRVSFRYHGQESQFALDNISLTIPAGKVTAVVGKSGSGKTTLLKLILGYYQNYEGNISIGSRELKSVDLKDLRKNFGVVLQESFIFNDTIETNVTLGSPLDATKVEDALKVACLEDYVKTLPLKTKTLIGNEGKGLSQGQKQRMLLARAVYRSPQYLFLDEATNSLDATTESSIFSELRDYFQGRTVLMIAHRLSTVQHADKIIVIDKGKVVEEGNHEELMNLKGSYFSLVKTQISNYNTQVTKEETDSR
jgi:ATP-binding cassette subfamily B protein